MATAPKTAAGDSNQAKSTLKKRLQKNCQNCSETGSEESC
jgi:hypothetical protein